MRPAGDVRKALFEAAQAAPGATTRELASRACVGIEAARRAMDNLRRAGLVVRGEDRVVAYRNRPVATWLPAGQMEPIDSAAVNCLAGALQSWGRP